jgi:diaminopimelate epimerase
MSRVLPFTKMHGSGNDFVVLDGLEGELPPIEPLAARLLDRHFGIGGDQLLVVRESRAADFRMEIFNPDGSQVEMCANGIRAFYKYVRDRGHTDADEIGVETLSGIVYPRWAGENNVTVDMGRPVLEPAKIPTTLAGGEGPVLDVPLEVGGETVIVSSVSMGNPHAVITVDDPDTAPVERLGPLIENHPEFPNRVNVEFVAAVDRARIRQRTWERGTGETLACGSGAASAPGSAAPARRSPAGAVPAPWPWYPCCEAWWTAASTSSCAAASSRSPGREMTPTW